MLFEYNLKADKQHFYNITSQVREAVSKSGVTRGVAIVFCPHTTAGITINENADPDVVHDMLLGLDRAFPDRAEFRHGEGNSAAHLKAIYTKHLLLHGAGNQSCRCVLYCYRLAVCYADNDGVLPPDKNNWNDWKD